MFALVETEKTAALTFWDRFKNRQGWRLEEISSPRYLRVTLEHPLNAKEAEMIRRTSSAFKHLHEKEITGVVLPPAIQSEEKSSAAYAEQDAGILLSSEWYEFYAKKFGLAVSTPVPLYRRMAGKIVKKAVDDLELSAQAVRIAIIGRYVTHEIERCVSYIQPFTRHLLVSLGAETEAFCYGVQKMLGLSIQSFHGQQADIYVLFSVPKDIIYVPDGGVVVNISGGIPALYGGTVADGAHLTPPQRLIRSWPCGCDTPAFLAALAGSGILRADEVSVEALSYGGKAIRLY